MTDLCLIGSPFWIVSKQLILQDLNEFCYKPIWIHLWKKCFHLFKDFSIHTPKQIRGSLNKFPDFFRMGTFTDSTHTRNSSPLRSMLLRLQCTCTVPITSGWPNGSPHVWACQWPSSQPLSSPQLSYNDSLWV